MLADAPPAEGEALLRASPQALGRERGALVLRVESCGKGKRRRRRVADSAVQVAPVASGVHGAESGGSRIRTREGREPLTVFKTVAIVHSAIPP